MAQDAPTANETRNAYARAWIARRRAMFFYGKTCSRCPSTDRLELHHLDRSAKVAHRIWSWSLERRAAELAKCEILCHDCHLAETAKQRHKELRHGTERGYRRGCRCDLCRQATYDARASRSGLRLLRAPQAKG